MARSKTGEAISARGRSPSARRSCGGSSGSASREAIWPSGAKVEPPSATSRVGRSSRLPRSWIPQLGIGDLGLVDEPDIQPLEGQQSFLIRAIALDGRALRPLRFDARLAQRLGA